MRLVINGQNVEGSLEDLVLVLQNSKPKNRVTQIPVKEASDLDDTLVESAALRKKIAENPDYNPYPGVVPSTEPDIPEQQYNRSYRAESDTGISYD